MSVISLLSITAGIICFSYITNALPPPSKLAPLAGNLCKAPCTRSCSPLCLPRCCVGNSVQTPAAKPDLVISSVEEGETEECGEKGFNSPTDNSEDPPGTITIPLPPTMYTPPKPGEQPKELPLPDFKLPASILQGIPPLKSMTLTPEPLNSPVLAKPLLGATSPVVPPPSLSKLPPVAVSEVPVKIPPVAASANTLPYPKLPPVTISEIPGRATRLPPLPPQPKPKVLPSSPLITSLPKIAPIHITVGAPGSPITPAVHGVGTFASPVPAALTVPPSCVAPCDSKSNTDPIAKEMEQELNARYG